MAKSIIHREGYGIIMGFASAALLLTAILLYGVDSIGLTITAGIAWVLTLFSLYFFRDPERQVAGTDETIVSPADGKVIEISDAEEKEFMRTRARKVSIFLNVFDVHVNRAPTAGQVRYFRYQQGKFFRAYLEAASSQNEQTIIGVEYEGRRLVFKQIAGLIARRISCDIREGHRLVRGERIGMIKFGSRVDIFLPLEVELRVQLGDRVKGGESIIGVFRHVS